MKIHFNRLVAYFFLSLMMVNVAMAEDTPTCPSLKGSSVRSVGRYGPWVAFFNLDKSPFNSGLIDTTADKGEDAAIIAEAAFITTTASGNAHKNTWSDGRYYFVCSSSYGYDNYSLVSGTTAIYLFTPDYSPATSLTHGQNLRAPVQHTLQEKYELLKLEQSRNTQNPFR
jgi:hypothetical protein